MVKKINYVKSNKKFSELRKNALTLDELEKDFSDEDKKIIEKERKYYELLMQMRKTREKKGLTQTKLAKISGIPRTTLVKIESGYRNVTIEKLLVIADALDKKLEIRFV